MILGEPCERVIQCHPQGENHWSKMVTGIQKGKTQSDLYGILAFHFWSFLSSSVSIRIALAERAMSHRDR